MFGVKCCLVQRSLFTQPTSAGAAFGFLLDLNGTNPKKHHHTVSVISNLLPAAVINAPFSLLRPHRKASMAIFSMDSSLHLEKQNTPYFLKKKNQECEVKLHSFVAYFGGWVLLPSANAAPIHKYISGKDDTTLLYVYWYKKATSEQQESRLPTTKKMHQQQR